VRLYVSDAPAEPNSWFVTLTIDERNPQNFFAKPYQDPQLTMQPPGSVPIDDPNAKEIIFLPMADQAIQTIGYRIQVQVNWPENTGIQELYAFDVGYVEIEEPTEISI